MTSTFKTTELSSNEKGRHAELLAATALLANGYTVLEPISPQAFDMAIWRDGEQTQFVQVKTAFLRDEARYGGQYLVVKGAKNNGAVYTRNEVDLFAAVWDGEVYLFPNREISEYWSRPEHLATKWTKLERGI